MKAADRKKGLSRAERAVIWTASVLLALMAGWSLGTGRVTRLASLSAPVPAATATAQPAESLPAVSGPVDVNTAGLEELMTLPGIGQTRAQAILDWRAENGPFRYVEDLIQVPGIGEGILEGIMDYVTAGGNESYAENFSGG